MLGRLRFRYIAPLHETSRSRRNVRARTFKLGEKTVTLPRGTRVLLRTDLYGEDGFLHRASTAATVRDVFQDTYALETASGRRLKAERDQIRMAQEDLLADLGKRQWDLRRLRPCVMYEAVVGSRAWGLADEASDEELRGWFLPPFDELVGLGHAADEIQDPDADAGYWELEKLLYQALRADANTLECLWSPLPRKVTPLGEKLLAIRNRFISMNVLGSFGRYAESQFQKIERSERRNRAITEPSRLKGDFVPRPGFALSNSFERNATRTERGSRASRDSTQMAAL